MMWRKAAGGLPSCLPSCSGGAAATARLNLAATAAPHRRSKSTVARSPTTSSQNLSMIVEQLLRTVGTAQDIDQYLNFYKSEDVQQSAVIKVGGEVIRDDLDTFAIALSTLYQIGLFPIVVHGAGPQMNTIMDEQKIEPQYVRGMRVTDGHVLSVARKVFLETNLRLVTRLEELGTPCRPITSGVFEADVMSEDLGFVGEVTKVTETAAIPLCLARNVCP